MNLSRRLSFRNVKTPNEKTCLEDEEGSENSEETLLLSQPSVTSSASSCSGRESQTARLSALTPLQRRSTTPALERLDADDVTINTKVAIEDLKAMFCSPSGDVYSPQMQAPSQTTATKEDGRKPASFTIFSDDAPEDDGRGLPQELKTEPMCRADPPKKAQAQSSLSFEIFSDIPPTTKLKPPKPKLRTRGPNFMVDDAENVRSQGDFIR